MRIVKKHNAFYLQHSYRKEGKVVTKEKYLGKEVPVDIESQKSLFLAECRRASVYLLFDHIKEKYLKEWQSLPKSMKEKALAQLAVKFTYNTNAIEGSTITLEETEELLDRKISPNRPLGDVKETEIHGALFTELMQTPPIVTLKIMLAWHNRLFCETKKDIAGKIRDYPVRVGEYRAPDWQEVEPLLKELFSFLEQNKQLQAVELAARVHYRFEKIHPFGDGNGRIGRLLMNALLWQHDYPILVIEYSKRKSYYKALSGYEEKFVEYFFRRYLKAHENYSNNSHS